MIKISPSKEKGYLCILRSQKSRNIFIISLILNLTTSSTIKLRKKRTLRTAQSKLLIYEIPPSVALSDASVINKSEESRRLRDQSCIHNYCLKVSQGRARYNRRKFFCRSYSCADVIQSATCRRSREYQCPIICL